MNIRTRALSILAWVASLLAGVAAGGLMTAPDNGWRLSTVILLPCSFILPLMCPRQPQLCPILIVCGTPIGGEIAERYFGAQIGNLMPPFYFVWTLLWVAIGGIPGAAIGLSVWKRQRDAQQSPPPLPRAPQTGHRRNDCG